MSELFRHRRPDPPRNGPRRDFALAYDHPGAGSAASNGASATAGMDGVIAHAVDLGYRLIDEQLRQGQQAAQRLRPTSLNTRAIESDIKGLTDTLAQAAKIAIDAWSDLLTTARGVTTAPKPPANRSPDFSISVKSTRRAHVTLDAHSQAGRFVPIIQELKSATQGGKSLTDVRFEMDPRGGRVSLVVTVPDDIAPGIYTGSILAHGTQQLGGTVSVRIDP